MMEHLLEHVSGSIYSRKFILKGGMLITSMVSFEARSKMDEQIVLVESERLYIRQLTDDN